MFRTRAARTAIVVSVLWVLMVQLWGYIAPWESVTYFERFLMLNAAGPIVALVSFVGYRWARNAPKK